MITVAVLAMLALEPEVDRACRDDNWTNRCDDAVRTRSLERFGAAQLEDEAAAGVEVYRALIVDGYGRDLSPIAFERRPGATPQVVIYGEDGRRIAASVSEAVWNRIRAGSLYADRELVPLPPPVHEGPNAPPPPVCLHGWSVTVEMANSHLDRRTSVPVRRRTVSTCEGGLAGRYAFELAETALASLPPCDMLDAVRHRGAPGQLSACVTLEGDLMAAASLMNARPTGHPRFGLDHTDPRVWKAWLGTNGRPELDWAGEVVRSEELHDRRVGEFIVARMAEAPVTFTPERYQGVDGATAVIFGAATRASADGREQAEYEQVWVWDRNLSDWMVSTWRIGRFHAVE